MKYVYQLKLTGVCATTDNKYEKYSSTVFTSVEEAEKRIPQMIDMWADDKYLLYVSRETAKVKVIPLEIVS